MTKLGNKYIIMCVGFTHSGKTTFAKKLTRIVRDLTMIDNDAISSFVNTNYPLAVASEYNNIKRSYKDPNLRFVLSNNIILFCLKAGINIIHSAGNLGKDSRRFITTNAKKYKYQVITIYFNFPRKFLEDRISNTKKDTSPFKSSKNWSHILPKQDTYAELPPSQKNTLYFEIKNMQDYKETLNKLTKLLK